MSEKITVCPKCYEQFKIWLLVQAKRDSSTKLRQTKAYELWSRLDFKKDIEVKEG